MNRNEIEIEMEVFDNGSGRSGKVCAVQERKNNEDLPFVVIIQITPRKKIQAWNYNLVRIGKANIGA